MMTINEQVRIPVKVWLSGQDYRLLARVASRSGLPDVGSLLEQLATRTFVPPAPRLVRKVGDGETINARASKMKPDVLNDLVRMRVQGESVVVIATKLKVSAVTVRRYCRRLGL